jgi:recombination protein RecT
MSDVKQELEKRPAGGGCQSQSVKLTKNMTIVDMVKALEPEIKRVLPSILMPERFTRMALSAINNTPKLGECTPMSFIAALMNAAQLGLEPNTPLGQACLSHMKIKGYWSVSFSWDIGD